MINIEERVELATQYFTDGYNCCQSVVMAYADYIGVDKQTLALASAPFGGGMGRLREVCGSVSGMFMVSGFVFKADDPNDAAARKKGYQVVQELAKGFTELNGSIVCRELLGLTVKSQEPTPEARTPEYYKKRPCKELVGISARLIGQKINENEAK